MATFLSILASSSAEDSGGGIGFLLIARIAPTRACAAADPLTS